ncbi:type II toxin-antitoxin system PemK/MazF family toxin [Lacrimispora sp.]|uniref:type II toxin-antitoxin system PemK/MazF family toxin n=1 Tax=Lacrimispora sp. TaxID=2719234 RepID=UPI002FDA31C0
MIVLPFPFGDLSAAKKRPALILADLKGDDFIVVQITSSMKMDEYSVSICDEDFIEGSLKQNSNVRPNKIFTLEKNLILYKIGRLSYDKISEVMSAIFKMFENGN